MAESEPTPEETRVTRGTKAEGEVSFQSSENAYVAPKITPETARNYFEQNIHLATQIVNLLPQVFPGAPDIYVEDRGLDLLDEDPLAADLRQRSTVVPVPGRGHHDGLVLEVGVDGVQAEAAGYVREEGGAFLAEELIHAAGVGSQGPHLAGRRK